MWKCPGCETVNSGDVCIVCGEAKPAVKVSEIPKVKDDEKKVKIGAEERKKKSHIPAIILVSLLAAAVITAGLFIAHAVLCDRAREAIRNGDYQKAMGYSAVFAPISGEAAELSDEAKYRQAGDYVNSGRYSEASELLGDISGHDEDVADLEAYIELRIAYSKEQYVEALELCDFIEGYRDVDKIRGQLLENIYNSGVNSYRAGDYDAAEEYFEALEPQGLGYRNARDYMLLCSAHLYTLDDVKDLYPLFGFEDTNKLVLDDAYILDYLKGKWTNRSGDEIEFYQKAGDDSTWCSTNLPFDSGRWSIRNGEHYVEVSGNDIWQGTYEAVSANEIKLRCAKNGNTYTLYR